jgi:Response regulators consisting of a CheY-like receiver domain and a winged-helix DNA-binding domain
MDDRKLILILDDDPDLCAMIKMMLEFKGYAAIEARNEKEARNVLSETYPDLIIMDMLLSGIDGTDVCRRLKQDEKISSIPILMFSAHPNAKESCVAAGADDFISKPFEMNDMLGKIDYFMSKKTRAGQ